MSAAKGECFSEQWWKQVCTETLDFTVPKTFANVLNAEAVHRLKEGIVQAIRAKYRQKSGAVDLRIYREEELLSETALEKLFSVPPLHDEAIDDYVCRTFNKSFCIILNKGETYSEALCSQILDRISPLFSNIGMPVLGADITLFMGHYEWTPLGIHRDKPGENVIHFHLGPAPKTIYCWDDETYRRIAGGEQNIQTDIEALIPHANVYTQSAGDMFFMPWHNFHIGKSEQFSVTLTVWLDNTPRDKYVERIVGEFLRRALNSNEILTATDILAIRDEGDSSRLGSILGLDNAFLDLRVRELILQADKAMALSLESNGGWQSPPLTWQEQAGKTLRDVTDWMAHSVSLVPPFQILYRAEGETMELFVRGRKLELTLLPQVIEMIDLLNRGEPVAVRDLMAIGDQAIPEQEMLLLISLLVDKRGLQLIEN